jgi:hypothetical protein
MYQAEIRIRYSSSSLADSVRNALYPDDKAAAGTVRISSNVRGRTLHVRVTNVDRFETLQATLQDIFRCIHAAETSLAKLAGVRS